MSSRLIYQGVGFYWLRKSALGVDQSQIVKMQPFPESALVKVLMHNS